MNLPKPIATRKAKEPDARCEQLGKTGLAYLTAWNPTKALECFEEVAERCPAWHIGYDGQAAAYWMQGQPRETVRYKIAALKSSLRRSQNTKMTYFNELQYMNLTDAESRQLRHWAEYVQKRYKAAAADKGLRDNFDKEMMVEIFGLLYLRQGQYRDAKVCFEDMVLSRPQYSVGYLLLATALVKLGDIQEGWAIARRGARKIGSNGVLWPAQRFDYTGNLADLYCDVIAKMWTQDQRPSPLSLLSALIYFYTGDYHRSLTHAYDAVTVCNRWKENKTAITWRAFINLLQGYQAAEKQYFDAALKLFNETERLYTAPPKLAGEKIGWLDVACNFARMWLADRIEIDLIQAMISAQTGIESIAKARLGLQALRERYCRQKKDLQPKDGKWPYWATVPVVSRILILGLLGIQEIENHLPSLKECLIETLRTRAATGYAQWFVKPVLEVMQARMAKVIGPLQYSADIAAADSAKAYDTLHGYYRTLVDPGGYKHPNDKIYATTFGINDVLAPLISELSPAGERMMQEIIIQQRMNEGFWSDYNVIHGAIARCLMPSQIAATNIR